MTKKEAAQQTRNTVNHTMAKTILSVINNACESQDRCKLCPFEKLCDEAEKLEKDLRKFLE